MTNVTEIGEQDKRMARSLIVASLPLATFGLGYWIAPKVQVVHEVQEDGFFQVKESEVLSATVESLRAENKMVVWSYQGTAKVRAKDTDWWIFESEQVLIVPASVDYRLNLADLTLADVDYDEKAKLVRVKLPKLRLSDVAFAPERATAINGGILTMNDDKVQALNKRAYATARKAITAQAQQRAMLDVAKRNACENVQEYFEIPLRITGHPDVKVVAAF
ncbi:DUF4230 domain-containing protein [Altererythrobacter luteolus]|uniref:DUF4230 domain-containing protein n=1 Tax=Pontixanthobacter luteolus TaxID=295089 RepID=A0A6I4V2E7_9SPHN|nr:DUF4230 domain-containing protein [Pontixanthobacter luteolus]MXP47441.1 DUF4230 domain-containing protein [Pontixanthobacter luteolus]